MNTFLIVINSLLLVGCVQALNDEKRTDRAWNGFFLALAITNLFDLVLK